MRRTRAFLAGFVLLLFLGSSFNAYACLVPLYGAADATMGSGCSSPEGQTARQFCDACKTRGVQAGAEHPPAQDGQTRRRAEGNRGGPSHGLESKTLLSDSRGGFGTLKRCATWCVRGRSVPG